MSQLQYFQEYIDRINYALDKELESYSWSKFYKPLKYATKDGKRLRPLMLLLAADSVGKITEEVYLAAIAVELLHTESIIHDDIIDNERERRGEIPFYLKYGYKFSILTADFVLGMILNIISRIKNLEVANELSRATLSMSEGEALEIRIDDPITLDNYIKILESKTASLFEVSTKIGAMLANGDREEVEALATFGRCIGIAYQIQDDINDFENKEKLLEVLLHFTSTSTDHLLDKMHELYLKYIDRAEDALLLIKKRSELEKLILIAKNELSPER